MVRVSAALKPSRWVPPSRLLIVLVKREDLLRVAVVPLQRDLARSPRRRRRRLACPRRRSASGGAALVAVQVLDERGDAAGVGELGRLVGALVLEADAHARLRNDCSRRRCASDVVAGTRGRRRSPGRARSGPWCRSCRLLPIGRDRRLGLAAAVGLEPDLAVALDLELEERRERVDHRHADAVQAARDLVGRCCRTYRPSGARS